MQYPKHGLVVPPDFDLQLALSGFPLSWALFSVTLDGVVVRDAAPFDTEWPVVRLVTLEFGTHTIVVKAFSSVTPTLELYTEAATFTTGFDDGTYACGIDTCSSANHPRSHMFFHVT